MPDLYRISSVNLLVCLSALLLSCKQTEPRTPSFYNTVEIEEVLHCNCSIRALYVDENEVFFAGSNGIYGYLNTDDNRIIRIDTLTENEENPMFRGLARTAAADFILAVDNPALIYRVSPEQAPELVFKQDKPGTFYNAMAFRNDREGMIIGDPTDGCLAVAVTTDSGAHWNTVDCRDLPPLAEGEAAFAASNSNIVLADNHTWILTGGKITRVYHSTDSGRNWEVFDTPVLSGSTTTGGYSMDFYNKNLGIIVGGDYTRPEHNQDNIARTHDGGKTWEILASGKNSGYKSSVRFVPSSEGKGIVAVGTTGIAYSSDQGETWTNLSREAFHSIRFLNDSTAYASGEDKMVRLIFSKKHRQD